MAEVAHRLGGLLEMGWDFDEARALLRRTKELVDAGGAGYVLLTARAA